jgi:tetratricopeptide (TPR) repeat protein
VFDYGTATVGSLSAVWPPVLLLGALAATTAYTLWRNRPIGLAGVWFFALLAPSSSIVPIVTQTMAEHRVYLALAAIAVLAVTAATRFLSPRCIWVFLGAAVLFGCLTFQRNIDYRDAIALWTNTTRKVPTSKRAHNNLGTALFIAGRNDEAIAAFQRAIDIDPHYASALVNLGRAQLQSGQPASAANNFTAALTIEPANPDAHFGLGFALASTGNLGDGIAHYREAIRLEPSATDYHLKLAQALFRAREPAEAINEWSKAIPASARCSLHKASSPKPNGNSTKRSG